jgi:glycosyltransferase involved in cell wall biosynthesis
MGRYVRSLLRDLATRAEVALTLLVREPHAAPAYRAIVGDGVAIAPLSAASKHGAFDRVWFPWNAMRFAARAPALVTINDDFAFRYPARDFVARWREQQPIRRAVRRAAHIVTISTWSRDALVARFALHPERISIIPLGPDPYFSPGAEMSPYAEPFVLAVGTGEARKNVKFLVDVWARAFPDGDVRLTIVGAADAALRAQLARTALPTATIAYADDALLRTFYRTAAAVAVPSLAEGFGLVAVEAQACGAAVIAARAAALPEAVGDAGMLADAHDADGWCAALRSLVRDAALNERYRGLARARWAGMSAERTTDALLAALELARDDRL